MVILNRRKEEDSPEMILEYPLLYYVLQIKPVGEECNKLKNCDFYTK